MADQISRPTSPLTPVLANDAQVAEQKMRRALGLNTRANQAPVQQRPEQARQRHRFVQDGGVPVVVLNHRTDESSALRERVAELEAAIDAERGAHAMTRRALSEQQAAMQSVETRFAHAELAHRDILAQEQRARSTLQEQIALLQAPPPPRPAQTVVTQADPAALPKKRGRPRIHPAKEAKPVRWWTPSFKAKTKA